MNRAPPPARSYRGWLLVILLGGLIARVLYLGEAIHRPDFTAPEVDAAYHDYWARALVSGDWTPPPGRPDPEISTRAYFRPPGYTYFLAALYWIGGEGYLAPRGIQTALGLLNILLAYFFARRYFGPLAGLFSAAGMAFYWAFVYFEAELLEPTVLVTLGWLLVMTLSAWNEKPSAGRLLLAGILAGLYAVVRPNILLFVAGVAVWIVRVRRADPSIPRRPVRWVAPFLLGAVLPVLPVTIRNFLAAGDRVLISSNAGINLFIGNNEKADGVVSFVLPGLGMFGTSFDYPAVARLVEKQVGHSLKDSEVSAYFAGKAREYVREHPGRAARLWIRKAMLFWGPRELGHNKEDHYERVFSPVLSWLPGSFPWVVALSAAGLYTWRRRRGREEVAVRRALSLMTLYVAALFVSYWPFFISGRYRLPAIPFLLAIGAYGVARLADLAREGARAEAVRRLLFGVCVFGVASINWAGYQPSLSKWYYEQGLALERAGRTEEAEASFRKAEAHDPSFFHLLHHNFGVGLAHEGRYEEAVSHLLAALRFQPTSGETLNSLGAVLTTIGRPADAVPYLSEALRLEPGNTEVLFNLGVALSDAGRLEEAMGRFLELIRWNPNDARAHAQMAMTLSRAGRLSEAAAHLLEAVRVTPDDAFLHNNLGVVFSGLGRDDEALLHLREAVRLNPDLADAWLNMGLLLARRGYWADACEALRQCLALTPDSAKARFYEGQSLARLGRVDEALYSFREVLPVSSTNAEWLIEASLSLSTREESQEQHVSAAIEWADRAIFLMPEPTPDAYNALSAALARARRFKEAATWAEEGARAADKLDQSEIARILRERAKQYREEKPWIILPATNAVPE